MTSRTEPLRVGLFLDDWTVPRWVEDIVRTLKHSTYAELALVVLPDRSVLPAPDGLLWRLWRNRRSLAFLSYQRLDRLVYGRWDDPFAPRDLRPLLDGVPRLSVRPIQSKDSDRFPDPDIDAIAQHRLDVALCFGFHPLQGRVLEIARHGVWSFHHGDHRENRGSSAATWEVLEGNPITGAVLQVPTEGPGGGKILGRVIIATHPRSAHRNRSELYERAWPMLPRLLERLQATGQLAVEPAPLSYDRRLHQTPGNTQALLGVARLASRVVVANVDRARFVEQWQLGYRLGAGPPAPLGFKTIEPPHDRFWADPFAVEVDDGYVVFFEEFVYPRRGEQDRGWISSFRIERDGQRGPVTKVLEEPHHLSYPLVFSWRGEWYMLPESMHAKRIVLYKSTHFPDRWEPCAVLFDDLPGVDNTIAEIDGHWWLWVTLPTSRTTTAAEETLLFHADTPLGPFVAHPANPVSTDARYARGAGRPFLQEGHWIRPVQDGTGRYGRAIIFMRIDRLDLHAYAESEVSRLEPLWAPSIVATHTYNRAGRLQVIDFVKRRSRLGLRAR